MVYLDYITCLRYAIMVRNPQYDDDKVVGDEGDG